MVQPLQLHIRQFLVKELGVYGWMMSTAQEKNLHCRCVPLMVGETTAVIMVKMPAFYVKVSRGICFTGFTVCSNTYKPIDFSAEFYLPCIPISRIASNSQ